jgi:type I restriction enzyme M protein
MAMAAEPGAEYGKNGQTELEVLNRYIELTDHLSEIGKSIKTAEAELDNKLYAKYPSLTVEEIKALVVDDKWMRSIESLVRSEIDQISQHLSNRIKELAERYESPFPAIDQEVAELESKVSAHLEKMGFVWK